MLAYLMNGYDFGYTWPWTHGHLVVSAVLAGLACLGRKRLPWWGTGILAGMAGWALAGFLVIQFAFGYNSPMTLPTQHFLGDGGPKQVLDIGCGSGRATIMVGTARPEAQIAALDNFSAEYIRGNGEALLRRNLKVAGIEDRRVRVITADMRKIPAGDGEFDGVVSTYAIDHLNREGIQQTLGEVARVLKPGGQFLLMVIRADQWMKVAYGPLLMHQRQLESRYWPKALEAARLEVVEEGTTPGSAHFLCRKKPVALP